MYIAVIERPDGSTYEQPYKDFEDLLALQKYLGDDYWIVDVQFDERYYNGLF